MEWLRRKNLPRDYINIWEVPVVSGKEAITYRIALPPPIAQRGNAFDLGDFCFSDHFQ
jgi:hypothetical protein